MKLIFGLGNPERKYQHSRHNTGVMVIDELARQRAIRFERSRFEAAIGQEIEAGETIWVVLSHVHMNCSGEVLRDIVSTMGIEVRDVLPVCDDFHLELGRLRFRRQGSSGGHNGLESIIECLGTAAFPRLRVGIGPAPEEDSIEFVLSRFTAQEWSAIEPAIARAAEAAWHWALDGIEACMTLYNNNECREEPPDES